MIMLVLFVLSGVCLALIKFSPKVLRAFNVVLLLVATVGLGVAIYHADLQYFSPQQQVCVPLNAVWYGGGDQQNIANVCQNTRANFLGINLVIWSVASFLFAIILNVAYLITDVFICRASSSSTSKKA